MLVSFPENFKFVINIIIKLSHTKNRLVIKKSELLVATMLIFFRLTAFRSV